MTDLTLQRIDGSALRFLLAGALEQPKQLVLLLHGSASDCFNIAPVATRLAPLLPDALFVVPNAPQSYVDVLPYNEVQAQAEAQPGMDWEKHRTWVGRTADHAGGQDAARSALFDALRPPVRALGRLMDLLLARHGLTDGDVALYGFSQGGMMALQVGVSRAVPCAGVVCHSGQFFGAPAIASRPRTLVIVGALELAPKQVMSKVYELTLQELRAHDIPVEIFVCEGLLHDINTAVVERCAEFLQSRFAI
jgi:phospholipase/carboxylesterase